MSASFPSRTSAYLPLHSGRAPAWLMRRMSELAGLVSLAIVEQFGPHEMLSRLSDPFWFQAFGCVLGFDWHSSGVTTTVCGALKESYKKFGDDLGIVVCGGKGGRSRKTPEEIATACERTGDDDDRLTYASRLSAKVDSAAVQDGYQIYHHAFFFVPGGDWCVVQQGMNEANRYARRYHWHGRHVDSFVRDPHAAVASDARPRTLNLAAGEGESNRSRTVELSRMRPEELLREIAPLVHEDRPLLELSMPGRHTIAAEDLRPSQLKKALLSSYEQQPSGFEQLLGIPGVGPKTLRSLSLVAEVIFAAEASRRDPAVYSFAHGGKDGHPYHVDRMLYDETIEFLRGAVRSARLESNDRAKAMKKLSRFVAGLESG